VLVLVPNVLPEPMPLLTPKINAQLVPQAKLPLLALSFLLTVLTVLVKTPDVLHALTLVLVHAQSVMLAMV